MGKKTLFIKEKEVEEMKRVRFILSFLLLISTVCGLVDPARAQVACWPRTENQVSRLIEGLEVGDPVYYENLTIIPVYNSKITDRTSYTTLDEAIRRKWITVTEVAGGQVPQLIATNHSTRCIFIMGGEILAGCKQDRIVGRDVLLRPKARNVIIPVYCVEQGRWQYESNEFYSKSNLGTYYMRSEAQRAAPDAQQSIWSGVADSAARNMVSTGTSAYQDIYESREVKEKLSRYEKNLSRVPYLSPDTVGAVIAVAGEIVSVDIFASPALFRKLWPKILKSSALAAAENTWTGTSDQYQAIGFLHKVHDKRYIRRPAVDLGYELSVADSELNANALIFRNGVTHLAVFSLSRGRIDRYGYSGGERRIPVMQRTY